VRKHPRGAPVFAWTTEGNAQLAKATDFYFFSSH